MDTVILASYFYHYKLIHNSESGWPHAAELRFTCTISQGSQTAVLKFSLITPTNLDAKVQIQCCNFYYIKYTIYIKTVMGIFLNGIDY